MRHFVNRHPFTTILVCAMVFVVPGYWRQEQAINKAEQAIDLAIEQRHDAQVAACRAFNDDLVANVNALNDRTQQLVAQSVTAPRIPPRSPEQQTQAVEFLAAQLELYEAIKIPERDCSAEGLAEFYQAVP